MNPSCNADHKSSWMSPDEARRTEFASVTLDMFNYLESLRQRLYEDDTTSFQLGENYNHPQGSLSSAHSPYQTGLYSSHTAPQISNQNFSVGPSTVDTYSISQSDGVVHSNQHATVEGFSSPRITNQKRTDSVNRGGSLRREAPADKLCMFCPASFTRNERLRYHIESVHLQLEPEFACDVQGCNRVFRQRSDLLRHQRTVHRTIFN